MCLHTMSLWRVSQVKDAAAISYPGEKTEQTRALGARVVLSLSTLVYFLIFEHINVMTNPKKHLCFKILFFPYNETT